MAEIDETYSAKQVATRIGTDAKTFRKWLRSDASPYPAVGQGQRYDFPKGDLPRIKKFFDAWKTRSTARKVTAPVNGHSKPELNESRKLPMGALKAEIEARGKARDEEYSTVDGEEPTAHELWLIEQDTTDWDEGDPRWIDAGPKGNQS